MANLTSSVVVGALGVGVVGSGPGVQKAIPMEVDRQEGSQGTMGNPGPSG